MKCQTCSLEHEPPKTSSGWIRCIDALLTEKNALVLQLSEVPKKLLEAVNAEQLRCGQIAEAFWNEDDKLNADLRVKLTQAEKSMAYMISTNIRAMRWREENFAEKPSCECVCHKDLRPDLAGTGCCDCTIKRKDEARCPKCKQPVDNVIHFCPA